MLADMYKNQFVVNAETQEIIKPESVAMVREESGLPGFLSPMKLYSIGKVFFEDGRVEVKCDDTGKVGWYNAKRFTMRIPHGQGES